MIWNTKVRKNEIIAEIFPFPSAVKNEDPKILIPIIKNANTKILNAWVVIFIKPSS